MTQLPVAQVLRPGEGAGAQDFVELSYDERFLRRKRLVTKAGFVFVVDLEKTTSLEDGDALQLADGRCIGVRAAVEQVIEIRGDLARLSWHIGNRHTPCQIETDHLVIQNDPVIRHMLEHLGAEISDVSRAFSPEGGAYGHGRTHSHEHGHTAHAL